jgi:hypothetical protein
MKVYAKATIIVTLEVESRSRWSEGSQIRQVRDQARDDVVDRVRRSLADSKFKILGTPKAVIHLLEEEE